MSDRPTDAAAEAEAEKTIIDCFPQDNVYTLGRREEEVACVEFEYTTPEGDHIIGSHEIAAARDLGWVITRVHPDRMYLERRSD